MLTLNACTKTIDYIRLFFVYYLRFFQALVHIQEGLYMYLNTHNLKICRFFERFWDLVEPEKYDPGVSGVRLPLLERLLNYLS